MQSVIDVFNDRVKEVNLYFKFLDNISSPNVELYYPRKKTYKYKKIDLDYITMLKATAFLMIYNLIESSLHNGILVIYKEIAHRRHSYEDISEKIKEIWIEYNYKKVYNHSASWQSSKKLAQDLVNNAINKAIVLLFDSDDKMHIPGFSGSLDANTIRKICSKHGIQVSTHYAASGGDKLQIVKKERNHLAHGEKSFVECGRDFTISQLKNIKQQAVIYVRSIIRNMKLYIDNSEFEK